MIATATRTRRSLADRLADCQESLDYSLDRIIDTAHNEHMTEQENKAAAAGAQRIAAVMPTREELIRAWIIRNRRDVGQWGNFYSAIRATEELNIGEVTAIEINKIWNAIVASEKPEPCQVVTIPGRKA